MSTTTPATTADVDKSIRGLGDTKAYFDGLITWLEKQIAELPAGQPLQPLLAKTQKYVEDSLGTISESVNNCAVQINQVVNSQMDDLDGLTKRITSLHTKLSEGDAMVGVSFSRDLSGLRNIPKRRLKLRVLSGEELPSLARPKPRYQNQKIDLTYLESVGVSGTLDFIPMNAVTRQPSTLNLVNTPTSANSNASGGPPPTSPSASALGKIDEFEPPLLSASSSSSANQPGSDIFTNIASPPSLSGFNKAFSFGSGSIASASAPVPPSSPPITTTTSYTSPSAPAPPQAPPMAPPMSIPAPSIPVAPQMNSIPTPPSLSSSIPVPPPMNAPPPPAPPAPPMMSASSVPVPPPLVSPPRPPPPRNSLTASSPNAPPPPPGPPNPPPMTSPSRVSAPPAPPLAPPAPPAPPMAPNAPPAPPGPPPMAPSIVSSSAAPPPPGPPPPSSGSGGGRGALLASIQAGSRLKKVAKPVEKNEFAKKQSWDESSGGGDAGSSAPAPPPPGPPKALSMQEEIAARLAKKK